MVHDDESNEKVRSKTKVGGDRNYQIYRILEVKARPSTTNRPESRRRLSTPCQVEINTGSYGEKLVQRLFLKKYRVFRKMEENKSCSP